MAWTNGGPGSKIPAGVKREVANRQHHECAIHDPTVCTGTIDEYDHIINVKTLGVARAEATDPGYIQGLCAPCHKVKTQTEAAAARKARRFRPPEQHPGLKSNTRSA